MQIGTLKALGFKRNKIILHYISYSFWVSLAAAIVGLIAGRYFIGSVFIGMEMSFFQIPNGMPIIKNDSYGTYEWHKRSSNDWKTSSLNTILNTTFLTAQLSGYEDKIQSVAWKISGSEPGILQSCGLYIFR